MARSISEIYEQIVSEKSDMTVLKNVLLNEDGSSSISTNQDLLNSLQSDTPVAIWKLWAFISAVAYNTEEQRWDDFLEEVTAIKNSTPVYNRKWWVEQALNFQYNHNVVINEDTNSIEYTVTDEAAKIIGSCTVSDVSGKVVLKIRGANSDILTSDELSQFNTYINKIKPVGDRVIVNNFLADKLKIYYNIYYNPLLNLSDIKSNVESTINNYITNLPYDNAVNINQLTDLLQEVEGVEEPVFLNAEGKANAGSYNSFNNFYTTTAGYCKIDSSFPLDTTLNYLVKSY